MDKTECICEVNPEALLQYYHRQHPILQQKLIDCWQALAVSHLPVSEVFQELLGNLMLE